MSPEPRGVGLGEAARVWARVAALSFGGPAAQIGVMHRILVEERRWISDSRFQHALNFCMLLPGPEAMQLATYVGWLLNGPIGGLIAGGPFIAPGIVAILSLSCVYAGFGQIGAVAALFFGLKAAVLAIVLEAIQRLSRRALRNGPLRALAAAAFVAIYLFAAPFPLIVIAAGLIGFFAARAGVPAFLAEKPRGDEAASLIGDSDFVRGSETSARALPAAGIALVAWGLPVVALLVVLGPDSAYSRIALFFSQTAVVTFGGAYAALAYVAQQAVEHYGWLRPGEMLDGLGMAETTPGPLIMVLQFVGFMAAFRAPGLLPPYLGGALGGLIATWTTFAPCFVWIFLGAPHVERLRGVRPLSGALAAVGAAVVGVILNLAVWFAVHAMFSRAYPVRAFGLAFDAPVPSSANPAAILLTALGIVAVFRFHAGMAKTFLGCAAAGALLWSLGLAE